MISRILLLCGLLMALVAFTSIPVQAQRSSDPRVDPISSRTTSTPSISTSTSTSPTPTPTTTSYSSPTFIILVIVIPAIVGCFFTLKGVRHYRTRHLSKPEQSTVEGHMSPAMQHVIEMQPEGSQAMTPMTQVQPLPHDVAVIQLPIEPKDVEAGGNPRAGEPSVIRQDRDFGEPKWQGSPHIIESTPTHHEIVITTIPSVPLPRSRIDV